MFLKVFSHHKWAWCDEAGQLTYDNCEAGGIHVKEGFLHHPFYSACRTHIHGQLFSIFSSFAHETPSQTYSQVSFINHSGSSQPSHVDNQD